MFHLRVHRGFRDATAREVISSEANCVILYQFGSHVKPIWVESYSANSPCPPSTPVVVPRK